MVLLPAVAIYRGLAPVVAHSQAPSSRLPQLGTAQVAVGCHGTGLDVLSVASLVAASSSCCIIILAKLLLSHC
jgi:hypothetical protein